MTKTRHPLGQPVFARDGRRTTGATIGRPPKLTASRPAAAAHAAVSEVQDNEKGLASGIFETSNHLVGGAIGVALYASILSSFSSGSMESTGYRAAFLTDAGLVVVLALLSLSQTRRSLFW